MSAYSDLVAQTNGHILTVTGPDGGQCTAVFHYYCNLLGYSFVSGNAVDLYNAAPDSQWQKIPNTPTFVPQQGDVCIWNAMPGDPYGHVDVVDHGNVSSFTGLDQNWPLNTGVHFQSHNYNYVMGFLRPKSNQAPTNQGGNMSTTDINIEHILAYSIGGRNGYGGAPNAASGATDSDLQKHVGLETNTEIWNWWNSQEGQNYRNVTLLNVYQAASQVGQLQTTITNLQNQIVATQKQLADTTISDTVDKQQIDTLTKQLGDAADQLNQLHQQIDNNPDTQLLNQGNSVIEWFKALWARITKKGQ